MSARWESSKRPLHVRTVWTDGHRHVVLHKEEDSPKPTSRQKERRIHSEPNYTAYQRALMTPEPDPFTVTTVSIVFNGHRNRNVIPPRTPTPLPIKRLMKTYTIDVIPTDQVKTKNMNEDVTFQNSYDVDRRESYKEYYLDEDYVRSEGLRRFEASRGLEPARFDYHLDKPNLYNPPQTKQSNSRILTSSFANENNTSLTDRVMVWLDLASQTDDNINQVVRVKSLNETPKRRVITAQTSRKNKMKTIEEARMRFVQSKESLRNMARESGVHEKILNVQKLDVDNERNDGKGNDCYDYLNGKGDSQRIISRQEVEEKPNFETFRYRSRNENLKRQLHIFMPTVPNKGESATSIFSSKLQSLLSG